MSDLANTLEGGEVERQRELLDIAFLTLFPMPKIMREATQADGRPWPGDGLGPYTQEWKTWQGRQKTFERMLDAEAYVDAAMMLVPDGWCWTATRYWADGEPLEPARYFADCGDLPKLAAGEDAPIFEAIALSPALALASAALRARAHTDGETSHV